MHNNPIALIIGVTVIFCWSALCVAAVLVHRIDIHKPQITTVNDNPVSLTIIQCAKAGGRPGYGGGSGSVSCTK